MRRRAVPGDSPGDLRMGQGQMGGILNCHLIQPDKALLPTIHEDTPKKPLAEKKLPRICHGNQGFEQSINAVVFGDRAGWFFSDLAILILTA